MGKMVSKWKEEEAPKELTFADLQPGEAFMADDGDICLKVEDREEYNTVVLFATRVRTYETPFIYSESNHTVVRRVKLTVEAELEDS